MLQRGIGFICFLEDLCCGYLGYVLHLSLGGFSLFFFSERKMNCLAFLSTSEMGSGTGFYWFFLIFFSSE